MTPKRVALFIGVMAAVALLIYLPHFHHAQAARQQRQAAQNAVAARQAARQNLAAAQQAAQVAAARRAQFLARYLNTRFARNPAVKTVAVAAADEKGGMNVAVADALAGRFKVENVRLISSFFKPAFFGGGMFSNVFAGADGPIDRLALTNYADALLLARQQVRYSTNGSLDNVVSADMRLNVLARQLGSLDQEKTWSFTAYGSGFSPADARSMAQERLLKQITDDTNMSLTSVLPDEPNLYP